MPIQRATIDNLTDAFVIVKQMTNAELELGCGYRSLARRALAEIIEQQMALSIDDYLEGIGQEKEVVDRRNGTYRRNLLTALGDIEFHVPRTRHYCPTEPWLGIELRARYIDLDRIARISIPARGM